MRVDEVGEELRQLREEPQELVEELADGRGPEDVP